MEFIPCPLCGAKGQHEVSGHDRLQNILEPIYHYALCQDCGALYQSPIPDLETIASFYQDDYAPHQARKRKTMSMSEKSVMRFKYGYDLEVPMLRRLLAPIIALFRYREAVNFEGGGRALDIGCGRGSLVAKHQDIGWESSGVEFNHNAVLVARENGLEVFEGDLFSAAFPDNHFDLVTAVHLIEHLDDPKAFVKEIYRILKPNGRLMLKTPNADALGRRYFGADWFPNDIPRHLVMFEPKTLKRLVTSEGFTVDQFTTFSGPRSFLHSWDYRHGNRGKPSLRKPLPRFLGRQLARIAKLCGRADTLFAVMRKPKA